MSDFVELRRLINIVLRRWWLLLVLIAMGAAAGYEISRRQTPVYEATVTVLVGEITRTANLDREDIQMSELFAQTYADLALRQPVLQGVVEILALPGSWEDLREQVSVSSIEGTQLIEIKAEASTARGARDIADQVARHLILLGPSNLSGGGDNFSQGFILQQMEDTQLRILAGQARVKEIETAMSGSLSSARFVELQTEKSNLERLVADLVLNYVQLSSLASQDKTPNSLSIIEEAYAEEDPIRPRANLNIILGGGFGLLLALGVIFLWKFLDDRVKSADDLAEFEEIGLLGSVGRIKGRAYAEKLITRLDPLSPTRESYRMIRNKIRLSVKGDDKTRTQAIVVTSPEPGEGKSLTAANLAVSMALANVRTILLDADLVNPVVHEIFQLENRIGLATVLDSPDMNMVSYLQDTKVPNLHVITSGEVWPDRSERLQSERISAFLEYLKGQGYLVIVDSPPALLAADAAILANRAEGVVLVVRVGKSRRRAIRQALADLGEAEATILGCVLNNAHRDTNLPAYKPYRREKTILQHLKGLFRASD
jgi:non-specific protein-tyrosine kinase